MFHLRLYVRSENRRRLVTTSEPRTRDVGKPGSRVDDSTPHLRFVTRAQASFFYHGSPKSWDEWHLIRVEDCPCENAVTFEQHAVVPREVDPPEFWGPWIARLPYIPRSGQTWETPDSH